MNISMGILGGVFIGLASTLIFSFLGKIVGISGLLAKILTSKNSDNYWRYAFFAGLLFSGILMRGSITNYPISFSWSEAIIAGFLVGIGTRIGRGCTSGHGVCGLARFSMRSLAATLIFIITAMITVYFRGVE